MLPDFWIPLDDQALIKVEGAKAAQFLQGQLTCNIQEVNAQQSRRGAHCNAKGKVLCSLRVLQLQEEWYLLLPRSMVDLAIQQLKNTAALSRVKLIPVSEWTILGCYGEELLAYLNQTLTLPTAWDAVTQKDGLTCIQLYPQTPAMLLIAETARIMDLQNSLSTHFPQGEINDWRLLAIENKMAEIIPNTVDLFSPHMLLYPDMQTVSFNKGCYIGQEIIARTHYLGKVKRRLQKLELETTQPLLPGSTILNAAKENMGVVVDAVLRRDNLFVILVVN
ncbi:MAG: hypothetical protein QM752_00785 [Gammaproteobacteria bacterium]